ncbi:uncharacterized protein LOC112507213 [Cynara cardunculus var. scolymus]|uniref:DUF761 domain-containing protein n=1 Tax=Cynara cardunculus var. scolymus TaxID=59895 RepID=A0A103YMG8_CYNCS|nr:uncharacterized protein LOC112507213 [Cynara cardunculus var. scolymus]KVI11802.1 Protein of unknown function DUF761, plant [Cynara cardunculus var. scolymus]
MAAQRKISRWSLLGRLRTAVKKVTFLLNFNMNRLRLASSMVRGGNLSSRRLSFNERYGLTSIMSSSSDEDYTNWRSPTASSSPDQQGDQLQKTRSFPLQRTTSFPEEDDIDKKAEMFIANFYRQLRMERQVSLQLRYNKDNTTSNTYSP